MLAIPLFFVYLVKSFSTTGMREEDKLWIHIDAKHTLYTLYMLNMLYIKMKNFCVNTHGCADWSLVSNFDNHKS